MTHLASQIFRVRAGETGLVITLGFLLLLNSIANQVSDIVAVSGFLSEVGVEQILLVWIVDMLLILCAAGAQSLIIDRFSRVTLLRAMIIFFAVSYVVLRLMFTFQLPPALNYSLLFLLAEQQWLFFPLIFWILASDIFDLAQAKRLFPLMAALGFTGQVIGFAIAAAAPGLTTRFNITTAELLNFNVLIYLLAFILSGLLMRVKIREARHPQETVRETLSEGWGFVREVPAFRYLMISMLMVAAAITVFEYNFLVVSTENITEPGQFQTFYSLVRLGETVLAIIVQTFITSRLLDKLGLKNSFVILPVVTMGAFGGILGVPGLATTTGGWIGSKLIFNTVDQSARKAMQALVPEERRGRVSVFMDSYLLAVGVIIGALITGAVLILGSLTQDSPSVAAYLVLAGVLATGSLLAVMRLRTVYDTSMFNWRLKRRQRTTRILDKLDFE